jgi:hypothetical protein
MRKDEDLDKQDLRDGAGELSSPLGLHILQDLFLTFY